YCNKIGLKLSNISASSIFSLDNLFKGSPAKPPPRYILYLHGAFPIIAISANAGRVQPLGHPVILMVISSSFKPASSNRLSIFVISEGRYRSDSAIAKPQVGKATQAIEFFRNPV